MKTAKKNLLLMFVIFVCGVSSGLYAMKQDEVDKSELLCRAIEEGNLEKVKLLLDQGANINGKNRVTNTPLITACMKNNIEIARLLIEKGADVNDTNKYGSPPLIFAVLANNIALAKLLCNEKMRLNVALSNGLNLLVVSIEYGYVDMLEFLLTQGADVNSIELPGCNTPLIAACKEDNLEMVQLLIKYEADINKKNNDGLNPLMWACRRGNLEVVKFLIENDVDVNTRPNGMTPLMYACSYDRVEVVKLLLAKGADINAKDHEGNTVLSIARKRNNNRVMKILINQRDNKPRVKVESEEEACCICVDKFEDTDDVSVTPCGHLYHSPCILKWIRQKKSSCPVCRERIEEKSLKSQKYNVLPIAEVSVEEMDKLMLNAAVPICAKQSALAKLLRYYRYVSNQIPVEKLLVYYKEISFNHRFFNDNDLNMVLNFAIKVDARDRLGRSVLAAALLGNSCDQKDKIISKVFKSGVLFQKK